MKSLEQFYTNWKSRPVILLDMAQVQIEERLQVRVSEVIERRLISSQENRSKVSVQRMRLALRSSDQAELDAILVANIAGKNYIVDGHHRHKAYRLEGREEIPARVRRTTWDQAVLVTRLVNSDDRALEMTPEQYREALWQYIGTVTDKGRKPMSDLHSTRQLASRFRVSKSTVHNMHKQLEGICLKEMEGVQGDAHTGWPRWKFCKQVNIPQADSILTPDQLEELDARRAAAALGKTIDKFGFGAFMKGLHILRTERFEQREDERQLALELDPGNLDDDDPDTYGLY